MITQKAKEVREKLLQALQALSSSLAYCLWAGSLHENIDIKAVR